MALWVARGIFVSSLVHCIIVGYREFVALLELSYRVVPFYTSERITYITEM
jgi:hypothetical protein